MEHHQVKTLNERLLLLAFYLIMNTWNQIMKKLKKNTVVLMLNYQKNAVSIQGERKSNRALCLILQANCW